MPENRDRVGICGDMWYVLDLQVKYWWELGGSSADKLYIVRIIVDDWYNSVEYHAYVSGRLDALGQTAYAREAYEFALEAYHCAPGYHENIPAPPPNLALTYNIGAHNFAHCYVLRAEDVFENPVATLQSWGISSSKDIGEVVYGLVKVGLLVASPGDAKEQFDGLFSIKNLLSTSN